MLIIHVNIKLHSIFDTIFLRNTATVCYNSDTQISGGGGAIFISDSASIIIFKSTFFNNSAVSSSRGNGGGAVLINQVSSTPTYMTHKIINEYPTCTLITDKYLIIGT